MARSLNEEMNEIVEKTSKELGERLKVPGQDIGKAILEAQQKANESLPEHLKDNAILIRVGKTEMRSVGSSHTSYKVSSVMVGWRKRLEVSE